MGVTCQILLNNTKDVYRAGDSVKVTVKYVIDKPTEFISVTLSFKSKELSFWEPITPKTIYTKTDNFVDQRIVIHQASEGETVMLQAGTYDRLFCFVLPEDIPSSYKDFKCFISFFVQLEFVKPKPVSVPQVFYIEIEVKSGIQPRPDVRYRQHEVEKEFNIMFSKKTVTLMAGILTPVYLGKDLPVLLDIYNLAEVPLVSINTELIEFVSYKSYGNHVKQKSTPLKRMEITFLGINRLKTKHSLNLYFSTTPDKFSIHSNMLRKEYGIKVTLKFLFPHRELCLEIPVAIAEKMDDFEEKKSDVQAPSFWQVMNEKHVMEK